MPYPYPTEEEAYKSIVEAICQMGDRRHRERVLLFYAARRLRDDGLTLAETARSLGVTSRKVYKTLSGGVLSVLNTDQKRAMKAAREMARIISTGRITPKSVEEKLSVNYPTVLVLRFWNRMDAKLRTLYYICVTQIG